MRNQLSSASWVSAIQGKNKALWEILPFWPQSLIIPPRQHLPLGKFTGKAHSFPRPGQYPAGSYGPASKHRGDVVQGLSLGQEPCIWQTGAGEPFGLCLHSQLSAQSNVFIQLHLWSNHQFPGLRGGVKLEFHHGLFWPRGLQLSGERGVQTKTQIASPAAAGRKTCGGFWVKHSGILTKESCSHPRTKVLIFLGNLVQIKRRKESKSYFF